MLPRNVGPFRLLSAAIGVVGAVASWSTPSNAYVNQIVIDQTATINVTPVILGTSTPGPATSYTIYQGRIFGLLDPSNPLDAVITDISLASWSAFPSAGPNGQVQYVANFQIVTPTNPAQRSGLMIHEVPNRGGNTITLTGASLVAGATYVQSGWQGDLLSQCAGTSIVPLYPCVNLTSGPYGTLNTSTGAFTAPTVGTSTMSAYVVQVPVATTDGSPAPGYTGNTSNNIITGTVYSHICTGTNGCGISVGTATPTAQLIVQSAGGAGYEPYLPAGYLPSNPSGTLSSAVGSLSTLTSQTYTGVDGTRTAVSSSQWSWANCPSGPGGTPNPYFVCLASGNFNPSLLYEMSYTAQNPLVLGVGWAAFRDLASFLRYGTTAPGGGSNPIAGSITKAYTVGASQSGAMIHGFVFYGFNQDESNRKVFDGAWPQIDARMMIENERWGAPNDLMYLYRQGDEAPVWWPDYPNMARGLAANGMLHRCNATTPNTCPQILETFGSAEMYSEKMSVVLCGFTCVADIPLPANVYRYYSPGATHGGGSVSFNWTAPNLVSIPTGQQLPNSTIPETYTNNALQYDFIQLLMNGTPMPPSVYPTLASGQLVLNTSLTFPNIPGFPQNGGVEYGGNQAWPPFVYNFGPGVDYNNQSGIPTIQPPLIANLVSGACPSGICPVYVPTINADGNENVSSLPTVLGQAPLATYTGWNLATTGWYGPGVSNGPGSQGQVFAGAGNSGGYWPFWDTKANRLANGDPRLSLEERYGSHLGYVCPVKQSAMSAVEQNYLLSSDATTLINMAASGNVLSSFNPTPTDLGLANNINCGLVQTHKFNGGAPYSDILWRDSSGNVGIWLMNGSSVSQTSVLGNVPQNWSIVGQRDFNGDGNADILWRDTSGNVGIWLMNGTSIISSTVLGNVPLNWSVAATGNFDGTGLGDVVWRDTSGNIGIWFMNGTTITKTAVIGNVPINWVIAGADNHGDIFWRNSVTGDVGLWKMNGTTITQSVDFGPVPLSWTIAGIGDFDGNGSEDLLWRDNLGNVGVWLMSGTSIYKSLVLGNVPLNWTTAQTGDYANELQSGILWTDTVGDVGAWFFAGSVSQPATTVVYGNVGASWAVQALNSD